MPEKAVQQITEYEQVLYDDEGGAMTRAGRRVIIATADHPDFVGARFRITAVTQTYGGEPVLDVEEWSPVAGWQRLIEGMLVRRVDDGFEPWEMALRMALIATGRVR